MKSNWDMIHGIKCSEFDEEDRWINLYFKNKHVECVSTVEMV